MNIQNELQKIHTQYGTSEMANYQIQLLFEKVIAEHEVTINRLVSALTEIRKAEGRYSRNRLRHAENTIRDMQAIAINAMYRKEGEE